MLHARVGQIVTLFHARYLRSSLSTQRPPQPGRDTMPTCSHHGPTWVGRCATCRSPGREPWPHGVTAMVHLHRTCTALACMHGHTDDWRAACDFIRSYCTAPAPQPSTSARHRLKLALAPLSSTLALSDSMPPEVEAAASSTTGQCSWSAPMPTGSRAGWICFSELQKHHSPSDGRCPPNSSRRASWARNALSPLKQSLTARPYDACVR